ncbi:MAG: hypothetical protein Q9202_006802 [Teloschistes flavicans]
MKLGEGGEAFFVFETSDQIPESLQTSPVVSPAASPQPLGQDAATSSSLQEPEYLDISMDPTSDRDANIKIPKLPRPTLAVNQRTRSDSAFPNTHLDRFNEIPVSNHSATPVSSTLDGRTNVAPVTRSTTGRDMFEGQLKRSASDELLSLPQSLDLNIAPDARTTGQLQIPASLAGFASEGTARSDSPPPPSAADAVDRAKSLSKKLSMSKIPSRVTEGGDLMLDMTGYKTSEDEALRAEGIARRILSEELEGDHDIGALIGADTHGNLWIYSSEEAKDAAREQIRLQSLRPQPIVSDTASDPGLQSDDEASISASATQSKHQRTRSEASPTQLLTPPQTPPAETPSSGDPNRNYAKTLRLTSEQLKTLSLKAGSNMMSFSVNRAVCSAYMYYWTYDVPIVISDIDGTITKSVGQADTTRTYLNGVLQEGFKLPKGPVIMSPDRTMAALRREIYLRKPEVFKMACLRDILNLFSGKRNPFYAGFGNRLTDALSYRSVNIPSTRIFTINSNAEVSLDLLTLNKYKNSYVTMRELVDHFFPPVGLLVTGGGEEFTDFNYWREAPLDVDEFSDSDESDRTGPHEGNSRRSIRSEDEGSEGSEDDDQTDALAESYITQASVDDNGNLVDAVLHSREDLGALTLVVTEENDNGQDPLLAVDTQQLAPGEIDLQVIIGKEAGSKDP